uniref:Uncharacterized protein n=1 Tax=Rhodosorus marinus TaxID=101924 RepID=A0A7S2ZZ22_9RHOD
MQELQLFFMELNNILILLMLHIRHQGDDTITQTTPIIRQHSLVLQTSRLLLLLHQLQAVHLHMIGQIVLHRRPHLPPHRKLLCHFLNYSQPTSQPKKKT